MAWSDSTAPVLPEGLMARDTAVATLRGTNATDVEDGAGVTAPTRDGDGGCRPTPLRARTVASSTAAMPPSRKRHDLRRGGFPLPLGARAGTGCGSYGVLSRGVRLVRRGGSITTPRRRRSYMMRCLFVYVVPRDGVTHRRRGPDQLPPGQIVSLAASVAPLTCATYNDVRAVSVAATAAVRRVTFTSPSQKKHLSHGYHAGPNSWRRTERVRSALRPC